MELETYFCSFANLHSGLNSMLVHPQHVKVHVQYVVVQI